MHEEEKRRQAAEIEILKTKAQINNLDTNTIKNSYVNVLKDLKEEKAKRIEAEDKNKKQEEVIAEKEKRIKKIEDENRRQAAKIKQDRERKRSPVTICECVSRWKRAIESGTWRNFFSYCNEKPSK